MDLLQKHGHLKHDHRKSVAQKEEAEQQHHKTQQGMPFPFPLLVLCIVHMHVRCDADGLVEINELLGNFGQSHNDHPDRRSSGAGNMARDMEEFQRFVMSSTWFVVGYKLM